MHTEKCPWNGCDRSFSKENKTKALQAVAMHVGRTHQLSIKVPSQQPHQRRTLIPVAAGNGHTGIIDAVTVSPRVGKGRAKLSNIEQDALVKFIMENRAKHPHKSACFESALEAVGAKGKLALNSSAIQRYWSKADKLEKTLVSAGVDIADTKKTRKPYTKRKHLLEAAVAIPANEVKLDFCWKCGTSQSETAEGIVISRMMKANPKLRALIQSALEQA